MKIDRSRLETLGAPEIDFRVHGVVLTGSSCLMEDDYTLRIEVTGDDQWAGEYEVDVSRIEKIIYGDEF